MNGGMTATATSAKVADGRAGFVKDLQDGIDMTRQFLRTAGPGTTTQEKQLLAEKRVWLFRAERMLAKRLAN
jgi:hypothetical protein